MNWSKAKKAMRQGKKVSNDRFGKFYFNLQDGHFVCHFMYRENAWRLWTLDKADLAFFSLCGGWFIVKEVE